MDRAQPPFETAGPARRATWRSATTTATVQGNVLRYAALDDLARGCVKPLTADAGFAGPEALTTSPERSSSCRPTPRAASPTARSTRSCTPPAPRPTRTASGFVDPEELAASRGLADYYALTPRPGLRMISINTVGEGDPPGSTATSTIPSFAG